MEKENTDTSYNTPLSRIIFQRIKKNQDFQEGLPFRDFMEMALYDPTYGYYSNPTSRKIGRDGDFFTSVSVGAVFGTILSYWLEELWGSRFDSGKDFVVVEQGAHDGRLARDILEALESRASPLRRVIDYRVLSPAEGFPEIEGIQVVHSVREARAKQGVFFSNELQDAFPVHQICYEKGQWMERGIFAGETEGELQWGNLALPPKLREFVEEIEAIHQPDQTPEGYTTEVCPDLRDWVTEISSLFEKGTWLMIDYGHESEDFFSPLRSDGSLQFYRDHKVISDPLSQAGEIDITAHVNLTHLMRWAKEAGLELRDFTDQHHFLTRTGRKWLLELEENAGPDSDFATLARQFQTLTHPSIMGQKFKVLEFER